MRRARLAAAIALGALAAGALAAPSTTYAEPWKLTMEAGAEADSNVRQTETLPGSMPDGTPEGSERIAAPVARAGARIDHRDRLWGGGYVLGLSGLARLVASQRAKTENVVLYTGDARWLRALDARPVALGVRVTAADAVAITGGTGSRTFRNVGGDGVVAFGSGDDHRLTLAVGARAFTFKPNRIFTWFGPVANLRLDVALWHAPGKTRSLELAAMFGFESRRYDSIALSDVCPPDAPPAYECAARTSLVRRDRYQRAAIELNWTAAVVVTTGYQLTVIDSNSYGQSLVRHRVSGSATIELFAKLFGTATATLQIDQYPDGLLAEKAALQEVTTLEDENRSSLQVRLARELTPAWSLEARAAAWREFGNADTAAFRRELIYAGVIYAH